MRMSGRLWSRAYGSRAVTKQVPQDTFGGQAGKLHHSRIEDVQEGLSSLMNLTSYNPF